MKMVNQNFGKNNTKDVIDNVRRVCAADNNNNSIAVEFSHPHNYLHDCNGVTKQHSGWWCYRRHLEFIPDDNLPDIWEYIK